MKRERVLSRVFEDAADGLLLLRADGVVVDCNPAAVALLGCADRAEILGRHLLDFSPEQQPDGTRSADLARDIMARIQAEGRACFEWEHRRFDGGPLYVEILIVAVDLPEGRVLHANWRDISRRRQMARDLTYRQSLEALIRRISSRFINLPADEVDAGIEQALGELGAFVEADRSYVFGYADGLMHNLYEWCADDIAPQIGRMQHIPVEAMSWSNTRIMRGDILNITDVGNLPDEAQAEEAEFALQGIRSVLVVPMERRGQVVGFSGFDAVRKPRRWPSEVVDLLRLAASIIANVRDRRDAEVELRETNITLEQRIDERTRQLDYRRAIAEGLREGLAVLNSNRPLDAILDFVVRQAVTLLQTGGGALYLLDDDRAMLRVGASDGLDPAYTMLEIPAGAAATGRAVALGEPVAVPDMQTAQSLLDTYLSDPSLPPQWTAALEQLKTRYNAILAVPVRTRARVYGAITLYYPRRQQFTDDVIGLAVAFAGQAALVIENARLREQAREAAATAERSRLARELHDAVTQTLFSASIIADTLPDLWYVDPADARAQLDRLGHLTRGALAEMRTLLIELRPARLVEADMVTLLRQLVDAARARIKAPVTLNVQGDPDLPPDVKIAFYRVAQEALNNVIRHAGAGHVFVSLRCAAATVSLQVLDDGCGFDSAAIAAGHFGVQIMEERAAEVGADLTIDTRPGEGTALQLIWSRTI